MIPTKKTLKLSRNHGQRLEKTETLLDDSMDDFIVTRPLRAERKSANKSNSSSDLKLTGDQKEKSSKNKVIGLPPIQTENENQCESVLVKPDELPILNQWPLCSKTLNDPEETNKSNICKHDRPIGDYTEPSSTVGYLQTENLNEPLGSRRPQAQRNKSTRTTKTRRKAVDPCDLSLALALSESMQSANESARKQEEELLLTENLTEVISDLRKEEHVSGTLSYVFPVQKADPVTKVKRKAIKTTKKEREHHTLVLRSQSERERLIADRAASILSRDPDDPLRPPKSSFIYPRPTSEFLQQYFQEERSLWQRTSLHDVSTIDQSDFFYVKGLCSVISPQKTKSGYSNILLHVSQLPGRNSSQMDPGGLSSTQALLEELALAAEGGFLEEPITEENLVVSRPKAVALNQLSENFSQLVDNPLLSDFIIRTKNKNIWAHRLVFAVRFPDILTCVTNEKEAKEKPILDWSSFSASSVIRVLGFIYSASYEHNEADARHVYRIARHHQMNSLLELLPHQYDSDSTASDEDNEDDAMKIDQTIASTSKNSFNRSFLPEPFSDESKKKLEIGESELQQESAREDVKLSPSHHQEEVSILEDTMNHILESPKKLDIGRKEIISNINCSPNINHRSGKSITSAIDMEISNNTTDRVVPLSPDMFEETVLSDSDNEEPKLPDEDVIDLTQETDSERKSENQSLCASPFGGSCESNDCSIEKSDRDVSMADCSLNLSPPNLLPKNSTNSFRQNTVLENSAASSSRTDPSFVEDFASSWNCNASEIDHIFPDCQNSVVVPIPSPRTNSQEIEDPSTSKNKCDLDEFDEFPDELDSIFPQAQGTEPSPLPSMGQSPLASRIDLADEANTPVPRLAKKRKLDVTPLPDYQSMETPLLKQELVKYGLKPLKRNNAVKLLHHIYEELHPLVTDSESSFQDTPDRPRAITIRRTHQQTIPSPSKSLPSVSSQEEDESGHSQEDEESMIVTELDREQPDTQSDSPQRTVSLKDQLKEFLKKRPDIYKSVLTYEPISFEFLFKEVRKERIRCKAQELLDWLDEECITCRMKNNRNRPTNRPSEEENSKKVSPVKNAAVPTTKPATKARRVAKKLIP